MNRDNVIDAMQTLSNAIATVVEDVDMALLDAAGGELTEAELIAAENIVAEAATVDDYLINFWLEVNSNG